MIPVEKIEIKDINEYLSSIGIRFIDKVVVNGL